MPSHTREVRPCQKPDHVLNEHGVIEPVPAGWILLPPGDAALSRRIKADGPTLTMAEMKGRKRFSRGIWAPAERVAALRVKLAAERADPAYERRLAAGRQRRKVEAALYAADFRDAVRDFLRFHPNFAVDATELASLIAAHATPVGSGTVARTERIPIEQRAEAATIAWLRHQTTGYDSMRIPLIKGQRREVRKLLAQRSQQLLHAYRTGRTVDASTCPLQRALRRARSLARVRARAMEEAVAIGPVQGTLF